MKTKTSIINSAKKTIKLEGQSILNLSNLIDNDFAEAVELIYNSKGRVIITGIGKSAIIATKI
ncbi:MAG: D-arabinose 5-phosphate isomerase, partial [Olleya sp.]